MLRGADTPIPTSAFLQPRAEPEIALVLARPLRGPGLSVADVLSSERSRPAIAVGVPPRTRPPLAALSAMVSSRPMRQSVMRRSMISMAGRA
jgi:hypothetical protein